MKAHDIKLYPEVMNLNTVNHAREAVMGPLLVRLVPRLEAKDLNFCSVYEKRRKIITLKEGNFMDAWPQGRC